MRCFSDGQRLELSLTAEGPKAGAFAYSGPGKGWSLRLQRRGQRLEPSLTARWQRLESSTNFVPYPVGMAKNATGYSTSTERKGGMTWMSADGIFSRKHPAP